MHNYVSRSHVRSMGFKSYFRRLKQERSKKSLLICFSIKNPKPDLRMGCSVSFFFYSAIISFLHIFSLAMFMVFPLNLDFVQGTNLYD